MLKENFDILQIKVMTNKQQTDFYLEIEKMPNFGLIYKISNSP